MTRVVFVVGARPNFMKVAPVRKALEALAPDWELVLVHTGQHYDTEMSDVFFEELDLPRPDVFLAVGSGTHGEQTGAALIALERAFLDIRPDIVVVAGDVNSTLAGALAAAKLHLPCAHVEAGLRSFDPTMPEEINRRLTDQISSLLLVHSPEAIANLAREGVHEGAVHLVGNTMIDTMLDHVDAAVAAEPWSDFGLTRGRYGLVTLHRPSLVDREPLLHEASLRLCELAASIPLVFPVHPRTLRRLRRLDLVEALQQAGVILTQPLGYRAFVGLEAGARFVLTDSGGVQEETSALGVRCFTLRDTTERPITVEVGTNLLLGARPEAIGRIPELLEAERVFQPIPLWDGLAGERCASVIAESTGLLAPASTTARAVLVRRPES